MILHYHNNSQWIRRSVQRFDRSVLAISEFGRRQLRSIQRMPWAWKTCNTLQSSFHFRFLSPSSLISRRWASTVKSSLTGGNRAHEQLDRSLRKAEHMRTLSDWRDLAIYFAQVHTTAPFDDFDEALNFLQQWATTLRFWSRQASPEGVARSVELLDRLVAYVQNNSDKKEELIQEVFHNDSEYRISTLVEDVLLNWREALANRSLPEPAGGKEGLQDLVEHMHPVRMFDFLKNWRIQGITMLPQIHLILMQTASEATQNSPADRKKLPLFFGEIIRYMLLEQLPGPAHLAGARPGVDHFILLLKAWAESGRDDRISRGIQTIPMVQELSRRRRIHFRPNTLLYNALLQLLASSADANDLRNAERVFHEMEKGLVPDASPDKISYRIIFYGLANVIAHDSQAKDRIMALLREMEREEEQHDIVGSFQLHRPRAQLDAAMYGYLILKLAHAGHFDQAEQVYQSLLSMYTKFREPRFCPDYHVKRALCFVYARTGRPREAEKMVLGMEDEFGLDSENSPKRSHYEFVLDSWATSKSQDTEQQTARWIRHIQSIVTKHNAHHLLPRRWYIVDLLGRLGKGTKENAAQKAELLFRALIDLEKSVNSNDPVVNHDHYNRMIQIWAKCQDKEAPRRAEQLLLDMRKRATNGERRLHPQTSHYTAVINAWSRSRQPGSLERAEAIFNFVRKQYHSGNRDAIPDEVFYGSMISCYARSGDLDKMEKIATLMVDDWLGGNNRLEPNTSILNSMVLGILLKQKKPHALKRARRLVKLMAQVGVQADERTNSLLVEIKSSRR